MNTVVGILLVFAFIPARQHPILTAVGDITRTVYYYVKATDIPSGLFSISNKVSYGSGYYFDPTKQGDWAESHRNNLPKEVILHDNYPDPFNPVTKIRYFLPEPAYVKLNVYDVMGREVKILIDGFEEEGDKAISFDASDLSSGIYFYKLSVGKFIQMKKMVLLR